MAGVGEKLKQRHESLKLTQQQVADQLGVSVTTVKNWEAGRHIPKLYLPQTKALKQFVREQIKSLLDASVVGNSSSVNANTAGTTGQTESENEDSLTDLDTSKKVVTTEEEREGFYIVKSILREFIDPSRIIFRDKIGFCGLLLDDNNRKPICRLYFNNSEAKKIELFDYTQDGRKEEKVPIEGLNDIYKYADRLKMTVAYYDKK